MPHADWTDPSNSTSTGSSYCDPFCGKDLLPGVLGVGQHRGDHLRLLVVGRRRARRRPLGLRLRHLLQQLERVLCR